MLSLDTLPSINNPSSHLLHQNGRDLAGVQPVHPFPGGGAAHLHGPPEVGLFSQVAPHREDEEREVNHHGTMIPVEASAETSLPEPADDSVLFKPSLKHTNILSTNEEERVEVGWFHLQVLYVEN